MAVRSKPGFTLVEAMFAVFVFGLVAGGLMTLVVGIQRLTCETVARAETSVRMRELREKLLFHAAPPHDGRVWSGLLSGSDEGTVLEGDTKIKMYTAYGRDMAQGQAVSQRIELVPRSESGAAGTVRWLGNDGDRTDDRWRFKWLCPGGFSNIPSQYWLDGTRLADYNLFFVTLEMTAQGVTRRERMAVPLFGKVQVSEGKVFHD